MVGCCQLKQTPAASVLDVSCFLLWPAFLTTAVLLTHARAAILVAALIQVGMHC